MRLKDKIAIVVGAGQSPGEGLGNGRATVLRFVQEGAKVLAVDNNVSSAQETVALAQQAAGECVAFEADVAVEATLVAMVEAARRRWGRVDVLHYNVGVSIAGGDAPLDEITEDAFDRITTINLRGAIMACKHVLPLMRAQRAGVIITISSVAWFTPRSTEPRQSERSALLRQPDRRDVVIGQLIAARASVRSEIAFRSVR